MRDGSPVDSAGCCLCSVPAWNVSSAIYVEPAGARKMLNMGHTNEALGSQLERLANMPISLP